MTVDSLTQEVLQEERVAILGPGGADRPLSALCISGGGIRSATFALGALQSLADHGLLRQFDYLSTVSGGGYIGGWLSAWTARAGSGIDEVEEKLRSAAPAPKPGEPDPIQHLREYNNYLTPRLGGLSSDTWTVIAIVIRNIALNWLVLMPLLLCFLAAPRLMLSLARLSAYHDEVNSGAPFVSSSALAYFLPLAVGLVLFCFALYHVWLYLPGVGGQDHNAGDFARRILVPLVASTLLYCTAEALYESEHMTSPLAWYIAATLIPALVAWAVYLVVCNYPPARRRALAGRLTAAVLLLGVTLGSAEWLIAAKLEPNASWSVYVTAVPPLLALSFFGALVIFTGLSSHSLRDRDREWLSRASAGILLAAALWLVCCAIVLIAPEVIFTGKFRLASWDSANSAGPTAGWTGGMVSVIGTLAGWMSASKKGKSDEDALWMRLAARLAPAAFIAALGIGLTVLTNVLIWGMNLAAVAACTHPAYAAWTPPILVPWWDHETLLDHSPWYVVAGLAAAFLAIGWVAARFVNINQFSLHGMYRDRLIRAYLGASNPERYGAPPARKEDAPNRFTGFAESDNIRMYRLKRRPFHVVNTCLNLMAGQRLAWQQRKAESFTITPLHCGSASLGYRPSNKYGHRISLGTAVTISGAAASPAMGYHSSPAIGFILTLLNARLGAWLGNPGPAGDRTWTEPGPRSAVASLLREALGLADDRCPYVYLSDGGHFENLALYEMVRRECRLIVLLDSGCDPEFTYEDLGNALRKIRIDLGVTIRFDDAAIEPLRQKHKRCAVGRILYPAGEPGYLVYVKPMIAGDESPDVASYAAGHPAFPHESTANQWFNESQTESYRMLGCATIDAVCGKWSPGDAWPRFAEHVMSSYLGIELAKKAEA